MSVIGLPNAQQGLQTLTDIGNYSNTRATEQHTKVKTKQAEEAYQDAVTARDYRRAKQKAEFQDQETTHIMSNEMNTAAMEKGFHKKAAAASMENKFHTAKTESDYYALKDVRTFDDWERGRARFDGSDEDRDTLYGSKYNQNEIDGNMERHLKDFKTGQMLMQDAQQQSVDLLIAKWNNNAAIIKARSNVSNKMEADLVPPGDSWEQIAVGELSATGAYEWGLGWEDKDAITNAAYRVSGTFTRLYAAQAVVYNTAVAAGQQPPAEFHPVNMLDTFMEQAIAVDLTLQTINGNKNIPTQDMGTPQGVQARAIAEHSMHPSSEWYDDRIATGLTTEQFAMFIYRVYQGQSELDKGAQG